MHPLESPERKIDDCFIFGRIAWKQILKVPPGDDKRVHAAVATLKETVGLLENDGGAALGALVLDGQGNTQWSTIPSGANIFLRIGCRTRNPEGFLHRIWGRSWASVFPLPVARIGNRILHWALNSSRTLSTA